MKNYMIIAGVDEAGRGPLAGPVVAACVILDPNCDIQGLNDSKKLSSIKREKLFNIIKEQSLDYAIAQASVEEIDKINILQASLLAMKRAVEKLKIKPDLVQVDGTFCPDLSFPTEAIIKGDAKIKAISAASILAKVFRDRLMQELDILYPEYGFARHKGYPTKDHIASLNKYGILDFHRKSFKPVADRISNRIC